MAWQCIRSHRIYITSANHDPEETRSDMTFMFDSDNIFLDDPSKQRMKVSLATFGMTSTWTEINSTNNIVEFDHGNTTTRITIPEGNYPFYDLAQYITQSQDAISCVWGQTSNTFSFTEANGDAITIHFINDAHEVLGFLPTDEGLTGTKITSTTPIVPRQHTELYVRLGSATLSSDCLSFDNYNTNMKNVIKASNILTVIPITSSPWQHMFYDNTLHGMESGVYITNEKLTMLHILITDKYGNPATFMPDWTMSLKVEVYNMEDTDLEAMKSSLASIDSTLTRLLTLKVIR